MFQLSSLLRMSRPKEKKQNEASVWSKVKFILFDKNALPPYGENVLPTSKDLESVGKFAASTVVAISVMTFANSSPSFANTLANQDVLRWSLGILDANNPVNNDMMAVLINQRAKNQAHTGKFKPSDTDMIWLIKNLSEEGATLSPGGESSYYIISPGKNGKSAFS